LAGIDLFGLAIATWSTPVPANQLAATKQAPFIYNLLATIYLYYIGIVSNLTGVLFWPAAALHAIRTVLLARVWQAADGKVSAS
jgi:hypothetical protein